MLINYQNNENAATETKKHVEGFGVKAELLKFDVADRETTNEKIHTFKYKVIM